MSKSYWLLIYFNLKVMSFKNVQYISRKFGVVLICFKDKYNSQKKSYNQFFIICTIILTKLYSKFQISSANQIEEGLDNQVGIESPTFRRRDSDSVFKRIQTFIRMLVTWPCFLVKNSYPYRVIHHYIRYAVLGPKHPDPWVTPAILAKEDLVIILRGVCPHKV